MTGDERESSGTGDAIADDTAAFRRYLRAKRTVDDRALDRRLVGTLRDRLADRAASTGEPLRVLEAGTGIGTMVARLIDWEVLPPGETRYVAVDRDAGTLDGLEPFLREWAADGEASVAVGKSGGDEPETLVIETDARTVRVEPVAADAVAYVEERAADAGGCAADAGGNAADAEGSAGEWDALIGMALLDVLDLDGLETLLGALGPGGTYYFPITFDGGTRFRPSHPADRAVERRYHAHMDAKPGGSSRAGGDALARLRRIEGASLLGVAGSDWVVRPVERADGRTGAGSGYPGDEAFFLRHILDTVETAVGEVIDGVAGKSAAEASRGGVDGDPAAALGDWLARRRRQVDAGELVYLTHQLDLLGRVDPAE